MTINDKDIELKVLKNNTHEREVSDKKYAIKLVEKVVFGIVGLLLSAIAVAILSTINL